MSRPRKYTPNTLKKAVNGYFDSISRLVPLTEKRNTGRKDSDGHVIYEEVPVLNRLGVQATVLEYLVPPTVGGLHRLRDRPRQAGLRRGRGHLHLERQALQLAGGAGGGPRQSEPHGCRKGYHLKETQSERLQHHVLTR